jgi:SAM-dependent methyltransferase
MASTTVEIAKRLVPRPLRRARWRIKTELENRKFRHLTVGETFERIYREGHWGSAEFDSGEGSDERWSTAYVNAVREFIQEHRIESVADLGCGDFRVGQRLLTPGLRYKGIDIVDELVERNRSRFGSELVTFERRNLIEDPLPEADLALVRQVLQHLSNDEISSLLANIRQYRYVIVTEHVPTGDDVRPNLNRPHGPGTRLPARSGVFLERPPFSVQTKTLLTVPFIQDQVIRTVLIENLPLRAA